VTVIADERQAQQRRFVGSPTFLIDGVDPFAYPGLPVGMSCRIYRDAAGYGSTLPPLAELIRVIDHAAGRTEAAARSRTTKSLKPAWRPPSKRGSSATLTPCRRCSLRT